MRITKDDIENENVEFEPGIWVFIAKDIKELYKKLCKIVFANKNPGGDRYWKKR